MLTSKPAPVTLRDVTFEDLPIFFEYQSDPEANRMAAFPARQRPDFMAHWEMILRDPEVMVKTIVVDGQVAGSLVCWEAQGQREVGYWLGREFWGQGVATRALGEFLLGVEFRPLHAHVARNNLASQRVLQKRGFRVMGEDTVLDSVMGEVVEELILSLEAGDEDMVA
jgi:RimJ/RimL family protein N-acetyltransferase